MRNAKEFIYSNKFIGILLILTSTIPLFKGFNGETIDISARYGGGTFEIEPWQSIMMGIFFLLGGLYFVIDLNKRK
ncbi:MAG: hypothetical protein AMK70_04265 [Nitrospira bacterium SG8_35_1]|nr:MAG: hypothetical protein AMK70_04265 [Nitrospira bacterium SG8_35_1]